jgi:oxysterol-binding protein-related protein 9/10/11
LSVATIEEQDEMESRRAWQKVAIAISKGDMDVTSAEKSKIENEQRELRKKEKEEGREWERRFFSRTEKDAVFEALGKKIGETLDAEKTGGVWAWDATKAKDAKPPFRK